MCSVLRQCRILLRGKRGESGAALAEFAIFTPILAMLLVGVAGLASYLIMVERLNSASQAALLHLTKNGWDWSDVNNVSKVTAAAVSAGDSSVVADGVGVRCFYGCPAAGGAVDQGVSCTSSKAEPPPVCEDTGKIAAQYVRVTVTASTTVPVAASFASFFGVTLPTSATLTAETRVH